MTRRGFRCRPLPLARAVLFGALLAGPAGARADAPETGVPKTGVPKTGVPETGVPETGVPETGVAETGGAVVLSADPLASLHPVLAVSLGEQEASSLLFLPLVWAGLDRRIDPVHGLAASVTPDARDTVFTVRLRPWHWSDGTPVTAADVLEDWALIVALGDAYVNAGAGGIPGLVASVTAPDPATVVFTLRRPVNPLWFELNGLTQIVPLPRQAWGRLSLAAQESAQSTAGFYRVVDGPFRLVSLALGRDAVFAPNRRYDGHRSVLDQLVLDFLPDSDVLEALRAGQVDAAYLPPTLQSEAGRLPTFRVFRMPNRGAFYSIVPNERNPAVAFFRDARVRLAIERAIDQARIIAIALHGQGVPRYSVIASTETEWLPPDLAPGGRSPAGYDPDAARRLLREAGFVAGPDGILRRHGRPLAFTVLVDAGNETDVPSFEIMQQELRRVGVAMRIHVSELTQIGAREVGPPDGWEAVGIGQSSTAYPDMGSLFGTGGSSNSMGFSDKRVDALLAAMSRSADPDLVRQLDTRIALDQPVIFRPEVINTYLYRDGLCGFDRLYQLNGTMEAQYLRWATAAHPCD